MLALATASPAVFTATTRVFNHDIMGCTADGVIGNHLYSGRALGMTEPGDVIQLHPELRYQWPFITAHYDRVGLSIIQMFYGTGMELVSVVDDGGGSVVTFSSFLNWSGDLAASASLDIVIRLYTEAIELNEGYAEAYDNRGEAYLVKGNFSLALRDLLKAVELKPEPAAPIRYRRPGGGGG